MTKLAISLLLLLMLLLTSCFKEDEKIKPHEKGDVTTDTIALTSNYKYQVYYDIGTGREVSVNLKKDWDLGFDCSQDGFHIILNTSNFMLAAHTGVTDFEIPQDTTGMTWHFDKSDGNPDSTAIGNWFEYNPADSMKIYTSEVYIINRGYDELGNELGFRKIIFLSFENNQYSFRWANLDGTGDRTFIIAKDPSVNYTFFSFNDGGKQISLEPGKYDWDLLFSQYTTLLITDLGEPYPYLVTGVISNKTGVQIARDTVSDFLSIDLNYAESLDYSTNLDEIGYDWKDIVGDINTGNVTYIIVAGLNYVIRDHEGFYYKLRFISFYNNQGEKGYPVFEYQRL